MRKLLLGIVLSGLLTACDGGSFSDKPSAPTTTVGTVSNSVEAELRGALARSGLGAKNIAFQAVSEVATFTVGTCEGEISKTSDGTVYSLTVSRKDQAEVLSTSFKAGEKGILDAVQQKTVTEKCGRL